MRNLEEREECALTLTFLMMCVNEYHLEFQEFLRTQCTNVVKHDIIGAVIELLVAVQETMSVTLREWNEATTNLADRILGFVVATAEGPCPGTQLVYSQSLVAILHKMLFTIDRFLDEASCTPMRVGQVLP